MSEKPTYTMEYDETIPTRERDGVIEHKHVGFDYWHPIGRMHEGCGHTEGGVDSDVRMCAGCVNADDISLCHTRRRQLGLRMGSVAHGYPRMVTADTWHTASIGNAETLMAIDEAVAELVSAKSMLYRVGKDSEHVQQAMFEQFTKSIDEVVAGLLKISRYTEEEMEAARDGVI